METISWLLWSSLCQRRVLELSSLGGHRCPQLAGPRESGGPLGITLGSILPAQGRGLEAALVRAQLAPQSCRDALGAVKDSWPL